jgi:hypothetical protein
MGKISWNTSAKDIDSYEDDEERSGYYDGPVPPPSIYRAKVAEITVVQFKSGNGGLKVTLDIDDPRKGKKQYTGARMWENVVDTPGSLFKVKQFLDAIGATGKDWAATVADNENNVTKIGRVSFGRDVFVKVATKYGKDLNDNQRAEVARFLPKGDDADGDSDDSDDDDSDDGDAAPF